MIRQRSFRLLSPDELDEIARELRRLAPRVGLAIDERVCGPAGGFGRYCSSFLQLDFFTAMHTKEPDWKQRKHLRAADVAIVVPGIEERAPTMCAHSLMSTTAEWIERTSQALRSQPDDAPPWPAIRASALTDFACRCWIDACAAARQKRASARLRALTAPPRPFATETAERGADAGQAPDAPSLGPADLAAIALELERIAPLLGPILDREMFADAADAVDPVTMVDVACRAHEMENGLPDDVIERMYGNLFDSYELPERERPRGATGALLDLALVLRHGAETIEQGEVGDADFRRDFATVTAKVFGGCVIDAAIIARRTDQVRRLAALLGVEHRLRMD